jgi:hypothetical protein
MNPRVRPAILIFAGAAIGAAFLATLLNDDDPGRDGRATERGSASAFENAGSEPERSPESVSAEKKKDPPRDDTIAEIDRASQSFRNSTLLVAIQESGFVCEAVIDVMSVGESPDKGWHAECVRGLAYAISVDAAGALVVTPAPASIDGLGVPVLVPQPSPPPR